VALGDVNQDGHLDVAVAGFTLNTVAVLLGRGDGSFETAVTYPVAGRPAAVVLADFTGDGFPDLATTNLLTNTVTVLRNAADWGSSQPALDLGNRRLAEPSAPLPLLADPRAADRQAEPVQLAEDESSRFLVPPGWTVKNPARTSPPVLVSPLEPSVDTPLLSRDN
jgi:hypothetical protein